jgi:HEAT repeat protein
VTSALADSNAQIRFQGLVALHHLDVPDFESVLTRSFDDADPQIRYVAVRIVEERFCSAPGERAGDTERRLPPELAAELLKILELDEVPSVRLAAAILLGRAKQLGRTDVEADPEPIVLAVNRRVGVREPEDEQAAIELSGDLALHAAMPGLERRAFGLRLRRDAFEFQAKVALAKMGHARAKKSILGGLKAFTRDGRTTAVAAAGAARLTEAMPVLLGMQGDEARADQAALKDALARLSAAELRG